VGEGLLRVASALGLACSCAQTGDFVARVSRESCVARQHRRLCGESVTGSLHSSTTPAPHPSPVALRTLFMHSSTGLAIWAGIVVLCTFSTGAMAPAPSPSPAPLKGPTRTTAVAALERRQPGWADGSVRAAGKERWVRAPAGRRSRWSTYSLRPNPRLCARSVTGKLHSSTTPAPHPSPVVLRMLFMHSSTGLAIPAGIVVLCRFFWDGGRPATAAQPLREVEFFAFLV
jgi:hypothetical protein